MANPLNIKAFFKFLSRNRLYTAINIFGLSVSLMFVILIGMYAHKEVSVDSRQANGDRIYILGDEEFMGSSYGIQPYLLDRYPEIEKMCGVSTDEGMKVTIDGEVGQANIFYADSTFFDVFSFRIIEGSPSVLGSPAQALVSERFARERYGDRNPIGSVIDVDGLFTVTVEGIMEDMTNSVLPESDIIVPLPNIVKANPSIGGLNNVGSIAQFILAKDGADLTSKTEEMAEYFRTFFWIYERGWSNEVSLTPLTEIYLSEFDSGGGLRYGDRGFVTTLSMIALVILVFAVLNYINLTVAQTGFRAKEMVTREFLGASRGEIFLRFIMESVAMCAVAFLAGLLLAGAFQDRIGNVLQSRIDVWDGLTWETAGVMILFVIVLGAIAGMIPAWHITRYRAIDVVRGEFRQRSKMVFSRVFIVFQNVITITLIACSLTIMLQIRHLINLPMGYNTENIMYLGMWALMREETMKQGYSNPQAAFRDETERLPGVRRVAMSNSYPLHGGNNNTITYEDGKEVAFQIFEADSLFFDIMGLKIIRDNHVAEDGYWVNRRLYNQLELPDDAPTFPFGNEEYRDNKTIKGEIENFKIWNGLSREDRIIIVRTVPRDSPNFWGMLIEAEGGDNAATMNAVKDAYRTMFEREPDIHYIEDEIYESYSEQRRIYRMILLFTVIAVVISMLGLLAMSTYYIRQRAGETAIRKVFGSTRGEVFGRLVRNFLRLVAAAFVIAVPLIWYFMRQWLSGFPYRISLSPWIFIAAGVTVLLIAAATVSWQSARAANGNPVDALHKE